jgi:hypothetical protein
MNNCPGNNHFPEAIAFALANKPKNRVQAEHLYKLIMNEFANWCIEDLKTEEAIGFKYSMGMFFDMPPLTVGMENIVRVPNTPN